MPYNPTQWNNGAAPGISAEKLNKIEQGIKGVTDIAESIYPYTAPDGTGKGGFFDGDMDTLLETGIYGITSTATNSPFGAISVAYVFRRSSDHVIQEVVSNSGGSSFQNRRALRTTVDNGVTWTDWDEFYTTRNLTPGAIGAATQSALSSHTGSTNNPHNVTKSQVGLGNVDNVKQASKAEFDQHANQTTGVHGATAGNVPNSIVQRTSDGNFHSGEATSSTHVVNRNFGDSRYAQLAASNTLAGNLEIFDGTNFRYSRVTRTGSDNNDYSIEMALTGDGRGVVRRRVNGSGDGEIRLRGAGEADVDGNEIWTALNNASSISPGSGYQKLASGLIIQWMSPGAVDSDGRTVNFPITFPTATIGGFGNSISTPTIAVSVNTSTSNLSSCEVFSQAGTNAFVLVIGY